MDWRDRIATTMGADLSIPPGVGETPQPVNSLTPRDRTRAQWVAGTAFLVTLAATIVPYYL